jgi:hypothetical protein
MISLVMSFRTCHRWQFGSNAAWGWSDGFAALYQFHYLVGFSAEVAIGSKWVVPPTVSAEKEENNSV